MASRIEADHIFRHHLHFSSVVHPRRESRRHHLRRHSAPLLRLLGSESIIYSVIISTSPASASFILGESASFILGESASFILGESASSSPPSLSSVSATSRIGVNHFFLHHLHFSSVGVVHPRRVGVIISAVTQSKESVVTQSKESAAIRRKGIKGNAAKIHFGCKGIRLFRCIKTTRIGDFDYFGCKGIVSVFGTSLTIYGMSLDIKSTVEGFPPISVANTRHLRSFIRKSRSFDGTCRLCVKVNADSASCNNQASDTFVSPVSTVQKEIQVHTDPTSCNRQTSDTFASHVPLNAIPVFCSTTVQDRLPNQVLILPEHLDFAVSSLRRCFYSSSEFSSGF
ncbi:hypothetical protein Bca101_031084 [Brassica carinata]